MSQTKICVIQVGPKVRTVLAVTNFDEKFEIVSNDISLAFWDCVDTSTPLAPQFTSYIIKRLKSRGYDVVPVPWVCVSDAAPTSHNAEENVTELSLVIHARWKPIQTETGTLTECSNCESKSSILFADQFQYCPICGAKMDA